MQKNFYQKKKVPQDRLGNITFETDADIINYPLGYHHPKLQTAITSLPSKVKGCTNITAGLRKANDMLKKTPRWVLKDIVLLSDGCPNYEVEGINFEVKRAIKNYTNIHTIPFANPGSKALDLLKNISSQTHRGKMITVESLNELTTALVKMSGNSNNYKKKRAKTTVLLTDVSGSMNSTMNESSKQSIKKIDVVVKAALQYLHYKQKLYS